MTAAVSSAVSSAVTAADLSGQTCLVTGANGGIGKATAEHFAAAGARVLTTDLQNEFTGSCDTEHHAYDLLDADGLAECVAWISIASPQVLFNNAALFDMGSVLDADLDQFDKLFGLNVRSMYAVMQASARALVKSKQPGSIINLASQAGHRGEALVAHYCATKASVISYTQSTAMALAPHKVRVNAISPGVIDTPMWKTVDALFAEHEGKAIGEKKREVGEAVPLGYMGRPFEVAQVATFLASSQSQYMTGQTLSVDGGNVLR